MAEALESGKLATLAGKLEELTGLPGFGDKVAAALAKVSKLFKDGEAASEIGHGAGEFANLGRRLKPQEIESAARTFLETEMGDLVKNPGKFRRNQFEIVFSDKLVEKENTVGLAASPEGKFRIILPQEGAPDYIVKEELYHLKQAVEEFGVDGAAKYQEWVTNFKEVQAKISGPGALDWARQNPEKIDQAIKFLEWEEPAKAAAIKEVKSTYDAKEAAKIEADIRNSLADYQRQLQELKDLRSRM